jgi:hypothetical protein
VFFRREAEGVKGERIEIGPGDKEKAETRNEKEPCSLLVIVLVAGKRRARGPEN